MDLVAPLSFLPFTDLAALENLRQAYYSSLSAPMDGMWDSGFTQPSPHWSIDQDGLCLGYFVLNAENTLLQFYVQEAHYAQSGAILDRIILQYDVKKAVAATIDTSFLSLCLDRQTGITAHTSLYITTGAAPVGMALPVDCSFIPARSSDLDQIIDLQIDCLGGQKELKGWLDGYSSNLISRGELLVLGNAEGWMGLGEYRRSDSQRGVVDLGVMVHPTQRRKGLAAAILTTLRQKAQSEGVIAICSTTVDNVASQGAIRRAGFICRHRIVDVAFG
ncbi:GNAT family N-acetyltransferase [bacterium]|nr:GNAT family N-acetyltransferase [bacterium]